MQEVAHRWPCCARTRAVGDTLSALALAALAAMTHVACGDDSPSTDAGALDAPQNDAAVFDAVPGDAAPIDAAPADSSIPDDAITVTVPHTGDSATSGAAAKAALDHALAGTGPFADCGDKTRVVLLEPGDYDAFDWGQGAAAAPGAVMLVGAGKTATRIIGCVSMTGAGSGTSGTELDFTVDALTLTLGDVGAARPSSFCNQILNQGGVWGRLEFGRGFKLAGATNYTWVDRNELRSFFEIDNVTGSFAPWDFITFGTTTGQTGGTWVVDSEDLGGGVLRLYVHSADAQADLYNGELPRDWVKIIANGATVSGPSGSGTSRFAGDGGANTLARGNPPEAFDVATSFYCREAHYLCEVAYVSEAIRPAADELVVINAHVHDITADFIKIKGLGTGNAVDAQGQAAQAYRISGLYYNAHGADDVTGAPHQDLCQFFATSNARDSLFQVENLAAWPGPPNQYGGSIQGFEPTSFGTGRLAAGSYFRNIIYDTGGNSRALLLLRDLGVTVENNTMVATRDILPGHADFVRGRNCHIESHDSVSSAVIDNNITGKVTLNAGATGSGNVELGDMTAGDYPATFPNWDGSTPTSLADLIFTYTPAVGGAGPIGTDGVWRDHEGNPLGP